MDVPSYSFLVSPMIALAALGVIVLLCRWVFSTDSRDQRTARRRQQTSTRGDYGLLVPVATARTVEDAAMLSTVLREAGIRCTVAEAEGGGSTVLVFRSDADRASSLVAG